MPKFKRLWTKILNSSIYGVIYKSQSIKEQKHIVLPGSEKKT